MKKKKKVTESRRQCQLTRNRLELKVRATIVNETRSALCGGMMTSF
jgi:hypothetical protein